MDAGLDAAGFRRRAGEFRRGVPVNERAAAMATVREGREIVNHLDPLGVGARDLRECLLIQIAAHRREAEMALKRAQAQTVYRVDDAADDTVAAIGIPNQRRGLLRPMVQGTCCGAQWACSQWSQRESSSSTVFEIAAHIVANHLTLLQKKDMRELTRSCATNGRGGAGGG